MGAAADAMFIEAQPSSFAIRAISHAAAVARILRAPRL